VAAVVWHVTMSLDGFIAGTGDAMEWVFDYRLAPVLLGDGVRLFAVPGGQRVRLEPTRVRRTGPLTDLRFRVSSGKPADAKGAK
jgi:hypothetical protein